MKQLAMIISGIKYFLRMALFCALLSSCVNDLPEGEVPDEKEKGNVNVKVVLQMPNAAAPKTYAISEIDENHVEQIDVLAFAPDASKPSGWAYAYRARGGPVTDRVDNDAIKSKKQSNVRLIKSAKPQRLVILANVRTQVEALGDIAVGADKDALLERLVFDHAGSWNANDGRPDDDPSKTFTPFPMWGEVTSIINDATTQLNNIKMLRGIARMDVLLAAAVAGFKLDEIYIYNSKSKGQIVPDSANLENLSKVKAATLPAGSINNAAALRYAVPPAMDRLFERSIYLFEAQAVQRSESSRATCMVVGGTYGTDGRTTYYRIDFFAKDANNNVTKDYADILRNHRYRVNIIKVSGSGYPTPEDAFNSRPLNMEVDVEEWNDGDMKDVIFDGQYYLSVNQSLFELAKEGRTCTDKLAIKTDFPVWNAQVASGGSWLSIVGSPTGGTGTSYLNFKVTANTGAQREGSISIVAGRLSYMVKVVQTDKPGLEIRTTTDTLKFPNYNIQPLVLGISWEPSAKPCQLHYPSSYGGVYLETIVPSIISGGVYALPVKPMLITADELKNNPYLTKESKLKITATSDDGLPLVKDVVVRQTSYTVVPEVEDFYQLSATQYSFKIKSNAEWRVKARTDANNVLQATSLNIGVQRGPGEHSFTFTLRNMMGTGAITSAKVIYTLESTQGLFGDVAFELNGIAAYIIRKADSGLEYDLLMQREDLPQASWYIFNNVPTNSTSLATPPSGPQNATPVNGSCARLNTGGFTDWRMPTHEELYNVFTYTRTGGRQPGNFNIATSSEYFTATQDGEASSWSAVTVSTSNTGTSYDYHDKRYARRGRCVRTLK